jgi:hypothetical protein
MSLTPNPNATARLAAGIFFPQRMGLRLTSHNYSPSVLGKIVRSAAGEPSFQGASRVLEDLAEITISPRQTDRIAHEVGEQLEAQRDQQVEQFQACTLQPRTEMLPALAVVEVDGGRLQIRGQGEGPGAHDASWREDKIAMLATAAITPSDSDPEPELPDCYRDRRYVGKLLRGMSGIAPMGETDAPTEPNGDSTASAAEDEAEPRKKPELLVRTYVATMQSNEEFGPMVAAAAHWRNFMNALHRAFVGDGSAWIWSLHKQYFPTFEAIVDFLHVLGHLFAAAKAAVQGAEAQWGLFQQWTEACWKGQVSQVIEQLRALQDSLGPSSDAELEELADDDPRKILYKERGYLENNRQRMDYPRYRQQGLPWTSSHIESTVKLFNRRVKGSEKFWSQPGAESILQLRAAFLSEDQHLERHLKTRPSSPFRSYKARQDKKAA